MHISTANVSRMVKDEKNVTIVIKYVVAYELSISMFRFDLYLF